MWMSSASRSRTRSLMGEELAVNGVVYRVGDPAPPPLPRRSEAEVMARWQGDKPIVSIFCPTYQHVGFIEDALRGFLGQDTDFPFEILVRDDASTDGTAEIVQDYAQRYPNIIRAVLETENRWPEIKPLQVLGPMARGEFIALCEGDDYWIAPYKLERQVNQLRAGPNCVVSHHQALSIKGGRVTSTGRLPIGQARSHSSQELARGAWTLTLAMVYRNVEIRPHVFASRFVNGDEYIRSQLGLYGGSAFVAGSPLAVYREHAGGIWSNRQKPLAVVDQAVSSYWIAWSFAESGNGELAKWWLMKSHQRVLNSLSRSHDLLPKFSSRSALSVLLGRLIGPWRLSRCINFVRPAVQTMSAKLKFSRSRLVSR